MLINLNHKNQNLVSQMMGMMMMCGFVKDRSFCDEWSF